MLADIREEPPIIIDDCDQVEFDHVKVYDSSRFKP